ncbi:MAG: hypothetical protein J7494_01095 [Sphingobium sp.]|nr:hypothetical protein [Sphingobium sp.]
MDRRLMGWFPALAIVAIMAIALFLGAWKSALLLSAPALVSAPIRWHIPGLRFLSSDSMEKGALCLILAILGMIALGVESSKSREKRETEEKQSASRDKSSPVDPAGGRGQDGASDSASEARPVTKQEHKAAIKLAIDNARSCDSAHREAAGSIRGMGAGPTAEARAAVVKAVEACEASWIVFNRPALRGSSDASADEESGGGKAEGLQACDQGYLGRWLTNDDLLTALDKGLPQREIGRIERMNSENEASITACANTLRQFG